MRDSGCLRHDVFQDASAFIEEHGSVTLWANERVVWMLGW